MHPEAPSLACTPWLISPDAASRPPGRPRSVARSWRKRQRPDGRVACGHRAAAGCLQRCSQRWSEDYLASSITDRTRTLGRTLPAAPSASGPVPQRTTSLASLDLWPVELVSLRAATAVAPLCSQARECWTLERARACGAERRPAVSEACGMRRDSSASLALGSRDATARLIQPTAGI